MLQSLKPGHTATHTSCPFHYPCEQLHRQRSICRRAASVSGSTHISRRGVAFGPAAVGVAAVTVGILAVGGVVMASAASTSGGNPRSLTQSGMAKFRVNDIAGSVQDFDAVIAASPSSAPYMWQRGLSLYYLGRFQDAAEQFRKDVAVNPNDTEESIWAFLAEAQLLGAEAARSQFLKVGRDSRPVMRAAYECFRTDSEPSTILDAAKDDGGHDSFYANLYVGLWHEAHKNADSARSAIQAAVATPYAQQSGDYMAALARVHLLRRGWA